MMKVCHVSIIGGIGGISGISRISGLASTTIWRERSTTPKRRRLRN
jgi:hypothetical protein